MLGQPFIGANGLLRGFALLTTSGLRRFVILPLLINIAVFSVSIWVLAQQFSQMMDKMLGYLPDWIASWLEWLLWPIFALVAVLLVFYTFAILANVIAAPFNGLLAEAVEKHLTGQPLPPGSSLITVFKEFPAAILDEAGKLFYFLLWAIPLLILFVIPLVNFAAPFIWLMFSAWMLTLEYCDYPMGNHNMRFKAQRTLIGRKKLLGLGFGGATLLGTMIPLVNFFVMPAAVAGATALWVSQLKQNQG
jgi:CysZ protein